MTVGRVAHTEPLVRLDRVSKSFGPVPVLTDITLSVAPGEVVVVLGPSGSGKSTLCRTINGLEPIDSGTITIAGKPMPQDGKALARLRSQVGMVFQSFNLFTQLTVLENVTLGPIRVLNLPPQLAQSRARFWLDRVGMAGHEDRLPAQLSGGQQQRVAIARAAAMEPSLILFDEPTSALDPELVHEVVAVMEQLAAQGMTMIVVTHELGFARRAADRVVFLAEGQIIEEADPQTFFTAPRTQRTQQFLASVLHH